MRLTLDDLEAERGEFEPFEIDLGDDIVINLPHPEDLAFQTLVSFNDDPNSAAAVLRLMMGDDAFGELTNRPRVTLGIMRLILEKYYAHYGLGTPGEDNASPRTSNGTVRPSKRTSRKKAGR